MEWGGVQIFNLIYLWYMNVLGRDSCMLNEVLTGLDRQEVYM